MAFGEAIKAIIDCKHLVAIRNPDSNSRAHGGVHPGGGGPDIDDGHIAVALKGERGGAESGDGREPPSAARS